MKFTPSNFLTFVKQIVMGGGRETDGTAKLDAGFKRDVNYSAFDIVNSSGAATLTAATGTASTTIADVTATPTQTLINNNFKSIAVQINNIIAQLNGTALETNLRALVSAASTTAIGSIEFVIPRDYDEATDHFAVRLQAAMAGATDSPIVTATVYIKRPGAAIRTGTVTAAKTITGTASAMYEFDLSVNSLLRDDALTITFVAGAHTTDAINVYGVTPIFRSCLVSYNETDGATVNSGNPLR